MVDIGRLTILRYFQQLNVPREEVEELLINLILEGKVEGRIDQVNEVLELDKQCVTAISPYPLC